MTVAGCLKRPDYEGKTPANDFLQLVRKTLVGTFFPARQIAGRQFIPASRRAGTIRIIPINPILPM